MTFFHQILRVYALKTIVCRNDNYRDLTVKVLVALGLHVVFFEFCKMYG